MGSLIPVPLLDLDSLKAEGYHPTAFVLPDRDSIAFMKRLDGLRMQNKPKFEQFDKDVNAFGTAPENCQSEKTFERKLKVFKIIEENLPKVQGATLHFCGSSVNNCGTDSCDIDLCWAIPVNRTIESDVVYPLFEQGRFDPGFYHGHALRLLEEVDGITNAKKVNARVKIIKFDIEVDGMTFPCDININNTPGVYNTFMIKHYTKIDKRLSILARVLKAWGKKAQIIDSTSGYLNSYTIVLMVIHFLQCGVSPPVLPNLNAIRPDLFDGNLDLHQLKESFELDLDIEMQRNDTPIGDLLIGFFRYYGMFDYDHNGIILRMGCVAEKPSAKDWFFLEEVYDRFTVPKNLDGKKLDYIKCTFLDTFMYLQREPDFERLMNDERCFMKKNF